ncbi:MAG: zinc ribbon domain-containing protein [Verrucomicrobia bacterium]|nr:zinc ribbon domain-containing protein [Verrucomicrobiota bacterium]
MAERLPPPEECAQCGARLPRNARACPECGADERTGWRGDSVYDGLDLPEEAWRESDDEAGAARSSRPPAPAVNGLAWYWWCAGLFLLGALLVGMLAGR